MDNLDKSFSPNTKWMSEQYNIMNQKLFGGELGECDFNVFTTGKGAEGNTLGRFKITARNIRIERMGRRMYRDDSYGYGVYGKTYVHSGNFYEVCRPRIELNGNYTGTEHAFLATLVHEMCHYYTYMRGIAPVQAHGREFKTIGSLVSSRSNGMFTIQRLASAEDMSELELNDEMKAKMERRLSNKKSSVSALVALTKNGKAKLTISSNDRLLNMIKTSEEECGSTVYISNDSNVIDFFFSKGYRSNMRTWRYWDVSNEKWVGEVENMMNGKSSPEHEVKNPVKMFVLKTMNGGVFKYDASSREELIRAIRERFPKMSEEGINRVINNPANYKMMENKINTGKIINEVIEEFINDEFGDDIEINPGMNLGKYSPFDTE